MNIVNGSLDKCAKSRQLDQNFDYTARYALKYSVKNGNRPLKFDTLKQKNTALYDLLIHEIFCPDLSQFIFWVDQPGVKA